MMQRALPDDLDVQVLARLARPALDRLPEHVRRALGNHGDLQPFGAAVALTG